MDNTPLTISGIMALLSLLSLAISIAVTIRTARRTERKDFSEQERDMQEVKSSLNYVRAGIDDIRFELRSHADLLNKLTERMAKAEATASSLELRIHHLENRHGGEE